MKKISLPRVFATTLFFCLPLLLAGCASQQQMQFVLEAPRVCYEKIDMAGRFSVRFIRDEEEQAMHGNFKWRQRESHAELTLLSPLGQIVAKLEVAPSITVLTLSDKDVRAAADPDALAKEALGWPLPVSGLREWMQGCARASDGRSFVATPANKTVITQGGWRLDYPVWKTGALREVRPKRVDMQHHSGNDDVSLRLVIDVWQPQL